MALTLVKDRESQDTAQLPMPGMPSPFDFGDSVDFGQVAPGQTVYYNGSLPGGPRRGVRGTVVRTLRRQAVVDLGSAGVWYVPYYYLSAPSRAA